MKAEGLSPFWGLGEDRELGDSGGQERELGDSGEGVPVSWALISSGDRAVIELRRVQGMGKLEGGCGGQG